MQGRYHSEDENDTPAWISVGMIAKPARVRAKIMRLFLPEDDRPSSCSGFTPEWATPAAVGEQIRYGCCQFFIYSLFLNK